MAEEKFLTVTEVTRYVKKTFDEDPILQDVWIRGELSNFKEHSRGHMYFTVKDSGARLQGVMFAGNNRFLTFRPDNGMKVLIRGNLSVYEPYGQYQLYAREMQPDGIGNLFLAYEQLKAKLEAEGLFEQHIKKPLPSFAKEIGIVTSPTGAAIQDMITTIKRRFPVAKITLLPVLVQGEGAASSIAKAIKQANDRAGFDVLIVGRGGGSIEELWAFNEELVARAIYESTIPIISAVGHETDYTIADFVADMRAATPTAAAELAVPVLHDLLDKVEGLQHRIVRATKERIQAERSKIARLEKSYAFRYPEQLLRQKEQQLDKAIERLEREYIRVIKTKKQRIEQASKELKRHHPMMAVAQAKKEVAVQKELLKKGMETMFATKENLFQHTLDKLKVLSPLAMMNRGYSLVYTGNELLKSVSQTKKGTDVTIQVKDGNIHCQVDHITKKEIL
ncbi:exodeoxyribonuclease VII large subunit [Bacillus alkalicellulosilyticus]|uniref:exodeoxyribonuclease VII large subunit n=1 Tax=Alkalihalobacterium alkalicellulosilyticum TaxID=1912214 RepID=UPI0009977046|nr:exodeoxyribonuclease VII large subunit [Bacillus alkalicellulosilyticus]